MMYPNPCTKVKAAHELAPEQQKALNMLLSNLPKTSELFLQSDTPCTTFCTTGFMAFSSKPLPKLPHEETWIWNQSNGKVMVQTERGNFVTLQKLNTRKKKNCPKPPSYKVWICYLSKSVQQPPHLNFIWCEKGVPAKDSSSSDSPGVNRSNESSGSDASFDNNSSDSFSDQNSSVETLPNSCSSAFTCSSIPCISTITNQQNGIYSSPPSFCLPHPHPERQQQDQPYKQIPPNGFHLPSLEDLVIMRKNQGSDYHDSLLHSPNRKRSLPLLNENMTKKRKLSHPVSSNINLPPLRFTANVSNDLRLSQAAQRSSE